MAKNKNGKKDKLGFFDALRIVRDTPRNEPQPRNQVVSHRAQGGAYVTTYSGMFDGREY